MRRPTTTLFALAVVSLMTLTVAASPSQGAVGVGAPSVSIYFASHDIGNLEPDFYRLDGLVFAPQQCGVAGCTDWFVSGPIQGDQALIIAPEYGPVQASFTRPVSDLSVRFAPGLQGTATYTLTAFDGAGNAIGSATVTLTEDFGDPENEGFGYHEIALNDLPAPARSFTFDNRFVRSSFSNITSIGYGVSSISYRHWGS
jgi:hypothetical protein